MKAPKSASGRLELRDGESSFNVRPVRRDWSEFGHVARLDTAAVCLLKVEG
jgi:hypothetical protein